MEKVMFQRVIEEISAQISNEKEIENKYQKIPQISSDKQIIFIDGGQAEILKTVDFSLQFIRIVGIIFKNNQKIKIVKKEFYLIVKSKGESFETEIYGDKIIDNIKFDVYDENIKEGNERIEIEKIGGVMRRLAELSLAKELMKEGIIILDGSMKIRYKQEKELMHELQRGEVCGLAKTSRIVDQEGKSMINQVAKKKGQWYYPIQKNIFVRLHEKSKYVFELSNGNIEIVSILSENSKDPVFLGYPYGLILVDKIARVTNEEKMIMKTQIMAKMGKKWKYVKDTLNVLNTHEILDNIS